MTKPVPKSKITHIQDAAPAPGNVLPLRQIPISWLSILEVHFWARGVACKDWICNEWSIERIAVMGKVRGGSGSRGLNEGAWGLGLDDMVGLRSLGLKLWQGECKAASVLEELGWA